MRVIDADKLLPGAKIQQTKPNSPRYKTACGGTVPDNGYVEVPFRTKEQHHSDITWRNAPVAMPILSTKLLALDKGELRYQCDGGQVVHVETGEQSEFISATGVYVMKTYIAK